MWNVHTDIIIRIFPKNMTIEKVSNNMGCIETTSREIRTGGDAYFLENM